MFVPVVAAHASRSWNRTVLVRHDLHEKLRDAKASIAFNTPDAGRQVTTWPDEVACARALCPITPDPGQPLVQPRG
jgi:hypothetical protein